MLARLSKLNRNKLDAQAFSVHRIPRPTIGNLNPTKTGTINGAWFRRGRSQCGSPASSTRFTLRTRRAPIAHVSWTQSRHRSLRGHGKLYEQRRNPIVVQGVATAMRELTFHKSILAANDDSLLAFDLALRGCGRHTSLSS